eukprot:744996-Amphidinium_carterae.1
MVTDSVVAEAEGVDHEGKREVADGGQAADPMTPSARMKPSADWSKVKQRPWWLNIPAPAANSDSEVD